MQPPEAGNSNLDPSVSRSRALNTWCSLWCPQKCSFFDSALHSGQPFGCTPPPHGARRCPALPRLPDAVRRIPRFTRQEQSTAAQDRLIRVTARGDSPTLSLPLGLQGSSKALLCKIHGPLTGAAHATSENLCDLPWTTSLTHSTKDSFTDHQACPWVITATASQSHGPCVAPAPRIFPIHVP